MRRRRIASALATLGLATGLALAGASTASAAVWSPVGPFHNTADCNNIREVYKQNYRQVGTCYYGGNGYRYFSVVLSSSY